MPLERPAVLCIPNFNCRLIKINLWFIPIRFNPWYTVLGGDNVEKLEFHLIDVKTGEIEPEVTLTAERDENGEIVTFKSLDKE